MKDLFRWNITKETGITILLGTTMILLSLAMIPFQGEQIVPMMISILLRDVLMIFVMGICFVTFYCKSHGKETWARLGIRKEKLALSLILNVVFAVALLMMFLNEKIPQNLFTIGNLYGAVYIFVAGIFEMLFIYGFLRMGFEKSFGVIPAILLTAVFYSFHHAGFQPEFLHLFLVGIMYVSIYYFTRNLLIIFPFFWGVGALWDVLVDSPSGDELKNVVSFSIALVTIICTVIWIHYLKRVKEK